MSPENDVERVRLNINEAKLCREETYTDGEAAALRQLIPIRPDGTPDPSRRPVFMGMTHVATEAGPVPVHCHLEATSLEAAVREFPEAARRALERLVARARELQREKAGGDTAGPRSAPDTP